MDQRYQELSFTKQSGQLVDRRARELQPRAARRLLRLPRRRQRRARRWPRCCRCCSTDDTVAPSAPTGVTATRRASARVTLNWTASTDNVGVDELRRAPLDHRRASRRAPANRVATVTSDDLVRRHGRAPGTYHYRVIAEDAAGNASAAVGRGLGHRRWPTRRAPTVSITAPAGGRDRARHRDGDARPPPTTSASPACSSSSTARTSAPRTRARPTRVTLGHDARRPPGSHTLTAVARDAAGNQAHGRASA